MSQIWVYVVSANDIETGLVSAERETTAATKKVNEPHIE
jgi:hypothetical protein